MSKPPAGTLPPGALPAGSAPKVFPAVDARTASLPQPTQNAPLGVGLPSQTLRPGSEVKGFFDFGCARPFIAERIFAVLEGFGTLGAGFRRAIRAHHCLVVSSLLQQKAFSGPSKFSEMFRTC